MSEDIIYYIQDKNTHLYRFYANGTALYLILEGNVLDQKEMILKNFNEEAYRVNIGNFHTDGNKISFDIETRGNFHIYQGDILNNGDIRLTIYIMDSKKSGQLVLKPFDSLIQFDWKNSKYNSDLSGLLDLRLSTFEQLQHTLDEANVFCIDSEGLDESDTTILKFLNTFLNVAGKELPSARLKIEDKWSIVFGNNSYDINVDDRFRYIFDRQILKDFNAILEAQGSPKRFFRFTDIYDFDSEYCYFYADKDFGLQIMEFLNNPPFYSYNDFKDRYYNRSIEMSFIDSTTEKEAKYFKILLPDF